MVDSELKELDADVGRMRPALFSTGGHCVEESPDDVLIPKLPGAGEL